MKCTVGTQAGKLNWHQIRAGCKCWAMVGLYPAGDGEPSKVFEHKSACSNLCSKMSLSTLRRRDKRRGGRMGGVLPGARETNHCCNSLRN
jgi:hypothetical protein